jgi:sigma-E factor negative regulatory protein RseC
VSNNITHEGVVVKVEGQRVTVQFVQSSACSACHAKSLCTGGTSDSAQRKVIANSYGVSYEVGDYVRIIVTSGLAWTAVLLAFVVPMVLALVCLFVVIGYTGSEMIGCLATLAMLAVYFVIVWMQRDHLERKTEFTLERLY